MRECSGYAANWGADDGYVPHEVGKTTREGIDDLTQIA